MKKFLLNCLIATLLWSCKNGPVDDKLPLPAVGEVVGWDSIPYKGDDLNKFMFTAKVVADTYIEKGAYQLYVSKGPDSVLGYLRMPYGGERYRPILRRADTANTFIIGFKVPKDTTFYEYFKIQAARGRISMDYTKTYVFQ